MSKRGVRKIARKCLCGAIHYIVNDSGILYENEWTKNEIVVKQAESIHGIEWVTFCGICGGKRYF